MKAENCKYVSIQYRLSTDAGDLTEESADGEALGFIFGAEQVFSALEEGLRGMEPGDTARVRLEPTDAYGDYEEGLVKDIPRASFPRGEALEPGNVFLAQSPYGALPFRVRSVSGETVEADFNHPLAGRIVYFDVKVEEVRDLSPVEVLAGGALCVASRYVS
jgi:FKBP-type peptidyl-prolyl cis-trans isomerase SlyD